MCESQGVLMLRWVAVVGALGGLVAVLLPGGAVRPDRPDGDVLVGAVGLVLVAALTFVPRDRVVRDWVVRLATGVFAVAVAGWAVVCLLADVGAGLPGSSTVVLAVSAIAVVVGLVADAVRPVRVAVPAALVVVLVVAAVVGALLTPGLPVRASQVGVVEPAAVATQPGDGRWSWRASGEVIEVVTAGAGVVVGVTGGELVALDGPAGAVRWRYARVGAHLRVLTATPDRAMVVAAFAPGSDPTSGSDSSSTGAELLVVLDAITGEVVRESTEDSSVTDLGNVRPTNSVHAVQERVAGDDYQIRAVDLRTGEDRWMWSAPDGCTSPRLDEQSNGGDAVLVPVRCGNRTGVVALDDRTGDQLWRRVFAEDDVTFEILPGDEFVAVGFGPALGANLVSVFVRADDGSELSPVDPPASAGAGSHPVLDLDQDNGYNPAILDPTTGEVTALPKMNCADWGTDTTTMSSYLQICESSDGAFLAWQNLTSGQTGHTRINWTEEYVDKDYDHPASMFDAVGFAILPAPGAVVVARSGDTEVIGYPA